MVWRLKNLQSWEKVLSENTMTELEGEKAENCPIRKTNLAEQAERNKWRYTSKPPNSSLCAGC